MFYFQAVPYSRDYKRKYEYLKSQLRKPVSKHFFTFIFQFDRIHVCFIKLIINCNFDKC